MQNSRFLGLCCHPTWYTLAVPLQKMLAPFNARIYHLSSVVNNLNDTSGDNERSRERVPCGHVCPELIIVSWTYGNDNELFSKCKRGQDESKFLFDVLHSRLGSRGRDYYGHVGPGAFRSLLDLRKGQRFLVHRMTGNYGIPHSVLTFSPPCPTAVFHIAKCILDSR